MNQIPSPQAPQGAPVSDLHDEASASLLSPPDGADTPAVTSQRRAFLQGLSFNKRTQLALVIITAVNFLATSVYVAIAWRSMKIQQTEMQRSNDLTQESIQDSSKAADAAHKQDRDQAAAQLAQMERSNNLTQEAIKNSAEASAAALATSREEAEASRSQSAKDAAASLEIARKSLDTARQSFETAQRARLVIEAFDCLNCSEMEVPHARPGTAIARLKNTGALPATNVQWVAKLINSGVMSLEAFDMYITAYDFPKTNVPMGDGTFTAVIGGGLTKTITTNSFSFEYPDNNSDYRQSYFIGKVLYIDGFNIERTLKFCAFWDRGRWEVCFENNSTD